MAEHKIVVLGGGGVGKSALTIRLVQGSFLEEYDPTIEDSYRKEVEVDAKKCTVDILDTAGQEEFSSLQEHWMRNGDAFIIVYSIVARDSFDQTQTLRDKILRAKDCEDTQAPPIVLAGNKCDLADDRVVGETEGLELAEQWGAAFFETSAKEEINNLRIFHECVRLVRKVGPTTDDSVKRPPSSTCCTIL